MLVRCFFFQAEDGIRDLVRSRGLGDVYKRQPYRNVARRGSWSIAASIWNAGAGTAMFALGYLLTCLLYTSDAADERSSVDLGGRRIIKKKNKPDHHGYRVIIKDEQTQTRLRHVDWHRRT